MTASRLKSLEQPGGATRNGGPGSWTEERSRCSLCTGIERLDRLLPEGGIPRGRLTEMRGVRGSGRTTFVLALMSQLVRGGERAAIVDLEGDLDPASFAAAEIPANWVWVITPERAVDALWAADLLLRSGHFGLVVLDGLKPPVRAASLVRLQRQARESETALLVGTSGLSLSAPGSLQLTFRAAGLEWVEGLLQMSEPRSAQFAVRMMKTQSEARVRFPCRSTALLGRHPEVPDRRSARWTEPGSKRVGKRVEKAVRMAS